MTIEIKKRVTANKEKTFYIFEWGRQKGQRLATDIYTFTDPQNVVQRNHNKEALMLLEVKRSELVLNYLSQGSAYIPQHQQQQNFLDFYKNFIRNNERSGNRSLSCSLTAFKKFLRKDHITASEITEELCERFRNYLLDNLNGETPADYFLRFRRVLKAATKQGHFRVNPAEDVRAKSSPAAKKKYSTSKISKY